MSTKPIDPVEWVKQNKKVSGSKTDLVPILLFLMMLLFFVAIL